MNNKTGLIRFKNEDEFLALEAYYQDITTWKDGSISAFIPLTYAPLDSNKYTDGYGKRKHPTAYKVRINRRYYRVYSDCFSNASVCYIIVNKQKFYIN